MPAPDVTITTPEAAAREAAAEVRAVLLEARAAGRAPVLGLATGHTPIRLYEELVRLHRDEGLDWSDVVTFNLDEYLGLAADDPSSFRTFMERHLFAHVNLSPTNVHFLSGEPASEEALRERCEAYERAIVAAGGIDLQILGLGRTGHIAFNEPGSAVTSRTRVLELDPQTRRDNARDFPDGVEVPRFALTMGIATILEARRLRVLAFGAHKALVVASALSAPMSPTLPASFLRKHEDVRFWIDSAAAGK